MDINVNVNVKVPAIEKLVDHVASGIGSVAGSMLAPWKAGQESKARLRAADGEAEAQKILAEGYAAAIQIVAVAQTEARAKLISPEAVMQGEVVIGELVTQRIQFQEEKRQANIASVVMQAADELENKEVQDNPVDHDWTARFFSVVQDVSSEEIQALWAKILAGEVERPGSTSIRTLSILKDLDRTIATLFRTLCSARMTFEIGRMEGHPERVGNEIVLSLGEKAAHNSLEQFGLSYNNLNVLNEYGLIIPEYDSSIQHKIITVGPKSDGSLQSVSFAFSFQGHRWVLVPTDQQPGEQSIDLEGIILSRSGMELARVVALEAMPEYEQAVVDFFQQKGFRVVEVDPYTLQELEC